MDAVLNRVSVSKIVVAFLVALLLLVPGHATAAPSLVVDTTTVGLVGPSGGNVHVSSSDSSTITFSMTANYGGNPAWISMNGQASFITTIGNLTTSSTLTFQAEHPPVNNTATVTLHATNPASGVADVVLTVTYTPQSGGGGGGGGGTTYSIFANPASVSTDNSSTPYGVQQVTLTTASPTSIPFTLASATPDTWLTVTTNSGAVDNNDSATLTLQFNGSTLTAGTYTTSIGINYGTSQSLSIQVTYTIIASTVVTLTPATAIWSGAVQSTSVQVSAGTSTFSAVVNSANPWIVLSWNGAPSGYAASALYGVQTSIGFIAFLNTAVSAPTTGTQGTVTVTDGAQHAAIFTITYNGTSGGGGTGTVSLTPNPVALSAALYGSCCVQTTVSVTSSVSGSLSAALSNSTPCGNCLTLSTPSNITAGTPVSITVYGNPTGLAVGTYSGTLVASVTASGVTSQGSTLVNFVVGGGGSTGGAVVAPTTLTFNVDLNHPAALGPQYVTIADQGNFTATVTAGADWLSLNNATGVSGGYTSPALLQVVANPGSFTPGTYNGTLSIQSTSGTTQVAVAMKVYNTPIIYAAANGLGGPGSISVTELGGNLGVVPQPYIFASDASAMDVQASVSGNQSWLQLNATSGTTSNTYPLVFPISFAAAGLPNGLYTAQITFTSASAADSPLSVPVVLSVGGSTVTSGITLSQTSITMNGIVNGGSTTTQLGVTATTTTSYTATSNAAWLTVTSTGTATTTTSYLTVTANPAGLTAGTYTGAVTVSGGGSLAQATITFVVSTSGGGGGGNVISDQSSLTFAYQAGGTAPAAKTLLISNQVSGTSQIAFTVQTSVNGGVANWLSANVNNVPGATSGQTQATVYVSVTPGSLPAGPYTGTVTITPTGGTVLSIPVTLNIQGTSTIIATPALLNYTFQLGGTVPSPQPVQVSGSATGLTYSVQVSTVSGGNWLSVNNLSGTTPGVLSVSMVSTPSLVSGNSYSGTITISGTGAAANATPARIGVTLTVTAQFPTITLVQGAAALTHGPTGMVSPGEIITIFGTGLGPTAALQTAIDPTTGKVASTLGNVQVLFNGYPAPLTYVSAVQINCVVPYEVAQLSSPYVQVKYQGQSSNIYNLRSLATSPGIFTVNASGAGQGAILNGDSTYNGTGTGFKPAAAGSTIQIYMTGEGQTSPQGVTGKVTCPAGCTVASLPVPLLPVAALINNQPATIVFFGEAPGLVSGVMQVNVVIPPNTPSGSVPLIVSVGSVRSQDGVTIAVQ